MTNPRHNVVGAMFDVRPVDKTGQIDIARISNRPAKIILRNIQDDADFNVPDQTEQTVDENEYNIEVPLPESADPEIFHSAEPIARAAFMANLRQAVLDEVQGVFADIDPEVVLESVGAVLQSQASDGSPTLRNKDKQSDISEEHYRAIMAAIYERLAPAAEPDVLPQAQMAAISLPAMEPEPSSIPPMTVHEHAGLKSAQVQVWYDDMRQRRLPSRVMRAHQRPSFRFIAKLLRRLPSGKKIGWGLAAGFIIFSLYGFSLKDKVIQEGNAAIGNLQNAKTSLAQFDFGAASENFTSAYEQFSQADKDINILSAGIGSLIAELPGAGKLKSAINIVEVGKLISASGQAMAGAMQAVARTGVVLNPRSDTRTVVSEVLGPLRDALSQASRNLQKASGLLADIDTSLLPADKQDTFSELKTRLPDFQSLVNQGVEYADFFERFVSPRGTRKYLLLFQNDSELRPTGGFPGTYGVVTFQDGSVKDFFADDIYNLDGQLNELIVPPLQLQHITPNWGMRDANWFADFPASARKILSFFRKESGYDADGVITISPQIMVNILKIVGPISMSNYGVTITADNFLTTLQSQVEYGDNRTQPKKIVMDLAPMVLSKLYSAPKPQWLDVFNMFMAGLDQKDILMYFKDTTLEDFVLKKGFAGQISNTEADFLMTTFSNIKGAKSDTVTDTNLLLQTEIGADSVSHTLTITRRHNGGKSKFGFYNRQNPAYVRVLVPDGSRLLGISGNSHPSYQPLLNYAKTDFSRDEDLIALESNSYFDSTAGVTVYHESGKTEFGFWMIVDPGEIKTVELKYTVPLPAAVSGKAYQLYVQKQSGLNINNFTFHLKKSDTPMAVDSSVPLKLSDDGYTFHSPLERDIPIKIVFTPPAQ